MRELSIAVERWPIAGSFTISRGSRTEATVVVASIRDGTAVGRGECVPYTRYGESVEGVRDLIAAQADAIATGLDRQRLQSALPAGAARNALDCALWDLEAKLSGVPVWASAGVTQPTPRTTAYTISLGSPDAMGRAALAARSRPLLKVKLGGSGDPDRIRAVRDAAPDAELVADANEAWDVDNIGENLAACERAGVKLVEQPLPAKLDRALSDIKTPIVICADESLHDRASLEHLGSGFGAVNIKLDKTGGLTEALELARAARQRGLQIMVGCMLGTSLGMAPAMLLQEYADYLDLDGPLLLQRDRVPGLEFDLSTIHPPSPALWG